MELYKVSALRYVMLPNGSCEDDAIMDLENEIHMIDFDGTECCRVLDINIAHLKKIPLNTTLTCQEVLDDVSPYQEALDKLLAMGYELDEDFAQDLFHALGGPPRCECC